MHFWKKDCYGPILLHRVIFLIASLILKYSSNAWKHANKYVEFLLWKYSSAAGYFWWNIGSCVNTRERDEEALNCQSKTGTWETQPFNKHQVSSFLLEKLCRAALSRLAQLFCFHDIAKSFSFSTVETEARNCTCHMFADFCITSAFCIIPAVTED